MLDPKLIKVISAEVSCGDLKFPRCQDTLKDISLPDPILPLSHTKAAPIGVSYNDYLFPISPIP